MIRVGVKKGGKKPPPPLHFLHLFSPLLCCARISFLAFESLLWSSPVVE